MKKSKRIIHVAEAKFLKELPRWNPKGLEELPQICVAGRSNVGKSTLINCLVERHGLARASSTPGRTQALIIFSIIFQLENMRLPFTMVDLPGYGYAKVPRELKVGWRGMVEGYLTGNPKLSACVTLFDIRRVPSEEDMELIELLGEQGVPILPVVTKIDKVPKTQRVKPLRAIAEALGLEVSDLRQVSAQERVGIGDLREELADLLIDLGKPTEEHSPELPEV